MPIDSDHFFREFDGDTGESVLTRNSTERQNVVARWRCAIVGQWEVARDDGTWTTTRRLERVKPATP